MNMCCLWCGNEMGERLNWKRLFFLSESKSLCSTCADKLNIIQGKRCQMCSRQSDEPVCSDCIYWQRRDPSLSFNHSVFGYNERMQNMIARWKYRGDYILGDAFEKAFRKEFKRIKFDRDAILVPIPLSEERLFERGFNQAQILADFLPMSTHAILKRVHSEKQSKKTRYERLASQNPFKLDQPVNTNTKVILIDDIYTTGTTLRHAATSLKTGGASDVCAYTLIRG